MQAISAKTKETGGESSYVRTLAANPLTSLFEDQTTLHAYSI